MKKILLSMAMVASLMAAPLISEAGSYRQQVLVTTTVLGAATGAAIGSNQHQPLQGMLIGGMIGAVVGTVLAQAEPVTTYRSVYAPQPVYKRVHHSYRRHTHHAAYVQAYRHHEYLEHEIGEHAYDDED